MKESFLLFPFLSLFPKWGDRLLSYCIDASLFLPWLLSIQFSCFETGCIIFFRFLYFMPIAFIISNYLRYLTLSKSFHVLQMPKSQPISRLSILTYWFSWYIIPVSEFVYPHVFLQLIGNQTDPYKIHVLLSFLFFHELSM